MKSDSRPKPEAMAGLPPGIELIIFDLDGTLVDSLEDIAAAVNRVLAERGLPVHDLDSYRRFIGDGVSMLIRRALPAELAEEAPAVTEALRRDYARHLLVKTRPFPGIPALLDGLLARHKRLAILSNKPEDATWAIAKQLLAPWPWLAVVGEAPGRPRKPDPAAALAIAGQAGLPPAHCLVVGDGAQDIQTAARAGMIGVGVLWGMQDRETLLAAGAERLIEAPTELLKLLDS